MSSIPKGSDDKEKKEKWVYPSEQMFFNAMVKKVTDSSTSSPHTSSCMDFKSPNVTQLPT